MKTLVCWACWCSGLWSAVGFAAQATTTLARNPALTKAIVTAKAEPMAANRAKLVLKPEVQAGTKFTLLDSDGKAVAAAVAGDGTLQAEVDPRKAYILSQPVAERRRLPKEGASFPSRYVTFGANGTPSVGGLFLRPAREPLTWDDTFRSYVTELLVGYDFPDGAEQTLAVPKTVTFFTEGGNARIVAESVVIARSGGSGYQRVNLFTSDFTGETQFTARAGPTDEIKSSVSVLREAGALKLTLPSSELPAFGVGSGTLTVTLVARDGSPLPTEQAREVQLSSRRLRLPASVTIPAGKSTAEVEFRSSGYGADQLTADSGMLMTMKVVRLIFPVAATVAAVAGGLLGGGARYLRNKNKRGSLLTRRLIEGVLVGVIFVGATWAGLVTVDVSTGILGTPFGAFVLAALSGYLGCVVLDWVTDKTFKGIKTKTE